MRLVAWCAAALALVVSLSFVPSPTAECMSRPPRRDAETVLVAGATGSIGKHVVQELLARGHRVRGLTRRPDEARKRVPEVEWVGGDLRQRETLAPVVRGVDKIIYAAGAKSWQDPSNTSEAIDFGGVKLLADLGKAAGAKRMVLISSVWVTREKPDVSKHIASVLQWKGRGEDALRASGLEYTILRPAGLGNGPKGKMGIALLQGDVLDARVYIEREDLAAVAAECAFHEDARNKTMELLNAATFDADSWKTDLKKMKSDS